ncbi:hypothetical protein G6F24_017316 [Rhizopus arrhizus]|nr:hypothetical protein G6F24_017316 [Rhizopus arrhizus]
MDETTMDLLSQVPSRQGSPGSRAAARRGAAIVASAAAAHRDQPAGGSRAHLQSLAGVAGRQASKVCHAFQMAVAEPAGEHGGIRPVVARASHRALECARGRVGHLCGGTDDVQAAGFDTV